LNENGYVDHIWTTVRAHLYDIMIDINVAD